MTIRLPINGKWSQPNKGDKSGSIAYSKNISLDEEGYLQLSPRTVNFFDDTETLTDSADVDFDFPVAFGRFDDGEFYLATADEPINIELTDTAKTIAEDASSNNPNLTINSHGCWFQNRWHESTSTAVNYNASGTWTANAISGLTSGVRHYMAVFRNKNSLAVSNGNTVKLYDTSYSNTVTLTLPPEYEIIGLAYNNYKLGIITRLGSDSEGQNAESYFFTWDGATTEAGAGVGIGSYVAFGVVAYQSSFALIDSSGRLLYFNGGGFDELARFPFYLEESYWGDLLNHLSYGNNMVVDGDKILINAGFDFSGRGINLEKYIQSNPSGVWCYDPQVGLYHTTSPSLSRAYQKTIADFNINTTTDIFTTSGTIPLTGNPIVLTSGTVGGLTQGVTYYIIRLSSTTFKIAETKQDAINGSWINITSVSSIVYFWMYDIMDYGASHTEETGAIASYETTSRVYTGYIFGGQYYTTALGTAKVLCSNVPLLENRGYFVTPKLFTNSIEELIPKIYIKHRPLDTNDVIKVKVKSKEYLNVPISSPNNTQVNGVTWTSSTTCTTDVDLSYVKTLFDSDEEFEIELTAGLGAGQMMKITNLTESSGTYTITVDEEVVAYSSGLKSMFVIDNWKVCDSATYSTQKNGVLEVSVAENSPAMQFKVELRGYKTTLSDIMIINDTHKPAK